MEASSTIRLGGPSDERFAKVDATDEWIEKHNAYLSQKRATEMENNIITITTTTLAKPP